jgi:hypothetical protein
MGQTLPLAGTSRLSKNSSKALLQAHYLGSATGFWRLTSGFMQSHSVAGRVSSGVWRKTQEARCCWREIRRQDLRGYTPLNDAADARCRKIHGRIASAARCFIIVAGILAPGGAYSESWQTGILHEHHDRGGQTGYDSRSAVHHACYSFGYLFK